MAAQVPKEVSLVKRAMEIMSKKVNAEIPIQQILLFFDVAENEGISMVDLRKLTQMPQASMSRNIKQLGVYLQPDKEHPEMSHKAGYGLIDTSMRDNANRRSFVVRLTAKGKRLLKDIQEAGASLGI